MAWDAARITFELAREDTASKLGNQRVTEPSAVAPDAGVQLGIELRM
jgi:hypothetical protein